MGRLVLGADELWLRNFCHLHVWRILSKTRTYFYTDIGYDISMKVNKRLDQLLEEWGGTIRTSQALKAGISKHTFYAYIKE